MFSQCKGRVLFVNHQFNIDNTLLVVIEKKQLSDTGILNYNIVLSGERNIAWNETEKKSRRE